MSYRVRKLSRENADRLAAGKPMKMLRGRLGIWRPGQDPLPLQDIHPARYRTEEIEGRSLITDAIGQPWRDRLIHIPNGGGRSKREGGSLKAQGVKPGVSDYLLAQSTRWNHGLWIELKASDGVVSADQLAWLVAMADQGYAACAAWGARAARDAIDLYVRGDWIQ